jgi:transposase
MLYFGIDWGEEHHQLCIRNEAGACLSEMVLAHSLAGFQRLEAERVKLGVPASECAVAIETAHNLLVDFLFDRGYPVYIISPAATKGFRNRQRQSGARDDQSDAALLAGILRTDRDSAQLWQPNAPLTQQLLAQVRLIETLRRAMQRQEGQLRALLLRAYPAALDLFAELTTQISLQFLITYPNAQEARKLTLADFATFCREQGYKRADLISQRYAHLLEAVPMAAPAIIQAHQEQIRTLAHLLLAQVRCRQQALAHLKTLFQQHPDAAIFSSLPGAGDLLAPALLTKFGDRRERFPSPTSVQALAGTCPITDQSGKKRVVRFRLGCDREFRRIAQQFARASLSQSGWATAYWRDMQRQGHSDSHAYRVLANRWLAIIWKLWQSRQPYDEGYHLQQRALRRIPPPRPLG